MPDPIPGTGRPIPPPERRQTINRALEQQPDNPLPYSTINRAPEGFGNPYLRERLSPQLSRAHSLEDLVGLILSADTHSPRHAELMRDRRIQKLPAAFEHLKSIAPEHPGMNLGNDAHCADTALAICRNLYSERKPVTLESVRQELANIQGLQKYTEQISLFGGRNMLVVAHGELWSESKNPHGKTPLETGALQKFLQDGGDPHRFAPRRTVEALQQAVGSSGSVALIRPEASCSELLNGVIKANASLISQLNVPIGQPGAVSPDQRKNLINQLALIADERRLFPERLEGLELNFRESWPGRADGWLELRDKDGLPVVVGKFNAEPGKEPSIFALHAFGERERLSVAQAKALALHHLASTPPGPAGFGYVFDGHGMVRLNGEPALFMAGGEVQAGELRKEHAISPKEFADALRERAKRFPGSNFDICYFKNCMPTDFIDAVSAELRGSASLCTFIGENELQQYGYSRLDGPRFLNRMLSLDRLIREAGRSATVRDLIDDLRRAPEAYETNPTVFVPQRSPKVGGGLEGHVQIN